MIFRSQIHAIMVGERKKGHKEKEDNENTMHATDTNVRLLKTQILFVLLFTASVSSSNTQNFVIRCIREP